jgi:hypothetical protein
MGNTTSGLGLENASARLLFLISRISIFKMMSSAHTIMVHVHYPVIWPASVLKRYQTIREIDASIFYKGRVNTGAIDFEGKPPSVELT